MNTVDEKKIYLTFDDGPTPDITNRVLTILDKYNAKATFFCVGKNVENNYELYKQIIQKGHSVGNHSYSHLNGWKTNNKLYINDVLKAQKIINSDFFRPPYGMISPLQWLYLRKKFKIIFWSCLSKDYSKNQTENKILNRIFKATKNNAIIVFHDNNLASTKLLNLLPRYLDFLNEKKYSIISIK